MGREGTGSHRRSGSTAIRSGRGGYLPFLQFETWRRPLTPRLMLPITTDPDLHLTEEVS